MILLKYIQENLVVLWGLTLNKLVFVSFNNELKFKEQAFALNTLFIIFFTYINTFKFAQAFVGYCSLHQVQWNDIAPNEVSSSPQKLLP